MRRSRFLPRGLGSRLFASHFLVAMVAALTLLVAIFLVAPLIFGELMGGMMNRMGGMMDQVSGAREMMDSISRAFVRTLLYSLLVSGLAAAVAAVAASLLVSRRIVGPVRRVLGAIRRVSAGSYGERVPAEGRDELGELAEGFNAMAKTLEQAERRRTDLIGDVSHELRTPLSNLRGYMEGLMEGAIEPSEETWALLYGEAERMQRLVDDLRRLSRAEAGRLELRMASVPPEEAVRIAAERTLPLFEEKGVRLEDQVTKNPPPVRADADRVVQILTNLLSNALHHTPDGGRVSVWAEARGEEVVFSVEDTGEGVGEEHLPRLFERFYRVEKSRSRGEARSGSGVGLAISRALVEAMGGRIWAESEGAGKGATFSFALPMADPKS
ncbi:MAG: sensor histidine kinase [Rubrobacteraceae bacterium]|jgi:two-component system sensor histidine kinase BaeS